jgi:hypothetical protein
MLRISGILAVLMASVTLFAASGGGLAVGNGNGFGGGVNPVAPAGPAAGPQKPMEMAYEPWVKTAAVGDFIVQKMKGGQTVRKEVKSIDDEFVTVASQYDKHTWEAKYRRKETAAPKVTMLWELDMKLTKTDSVTINGKKVVCEQWDGFRKTSCISMNGNERFKASKFQKLCAAAVPFGGVIREMQVPDDGKGLKTNGPVRTNNANTTLELVYEVTDFGTANDAKKK